MTVVNKFVPATKPYRWLAGSATSSWRLVLLAVSFGLVGGFVTFTTGFGDENLTSPGPGYRPPLFFVLTNAVYALAVVLTIPCLVAAVVSVWRRRWALAGRAFLHAVAPVLVYVVFFEGSHLVGCTGVSFLCSDGSFTGRAHLLHHTIVALPLAFMFAVIFRWLGGDSLSESR